MMIHNFRHKTGRSLKTGVNILFLTLLFFIPLKTISAFSDLPNDPLYKPYLEDFEAAHVIVGDTQGGKPTGTLRPNDFIQRDEFAKVAVLMRLLEQKQKEGLANEYQGLSLDSFTLKIAQLLKPYYKVIKGAKPFSDIEQKDDACASDPSGCQPWYTEYVNYASSQGMIKGYADNTFRPGLPILRIHALKLIMAENGNIPASQDVKFKKLASDPRIQKVSLPKCLEGAEPFILNANGGNTPDSKNLLAYALLADKLDLFGSDCQLFAELHAMTPEQRANVLQQSLTRKEIARYYALTTGYSVLMANPATDPTTSTAEENGVTYFNPDSPEVDQKEEGEKVADVSTEKTSPKPEKPDQLSSNKKQMIQNTSVSQMSIEDLAKKTQTGRCCTTMSLTASCKIIHFEDYVISETPTYNYGTYQGGTWYLAQQKGKSCYIPFGDILGEGSSIEAKKPDLIPVSQQVYGPITPDQNKRRLEINKNLDQCVLSGKTIKACRDMGLTHKTEGSFEYNEVLAWYKSTLAIKSRIDTNLTNLYVIGQGLTLEEAKTEGLKGKDNKPVEKYFVNQWYLALKPIRDSVYKHLDDHLNQGFTLEQVRDWGLGGKSKNDVKYAFVEGWYNKMFAELNITEDLVKRMKEAAETMDELWELGDAITGSWMVPHSALKSQLKKKLPKVTDDILDKIPERIYAEMEKNPFAFKFFYNKVKSGGVWDFKSNVYLIYKDSGLIISSQNNFAHFKNDMPGNLNYGYAGAPKFSLEVLEIMAGLAQIQANTTKSEWTWEISYRDDPDDQMAIEQGYRMYEEHRNNIDPETLWGFVNSLPRKS